MSSRTDGTARRRAPAFGALFLFALACGTTNPPRGFQDYRLGASRGNIKAAMQSARPLGDIERSIYNFIVDDLDGPTVSRWVDRRRVSSGDSVTVIASFDREKVSRVDVVYPPSVAFTADCPICAGLEAEYGPPTEVDSASAPVVRRWKRWSCCELRMSHAGVAIVVTYLDRRSAQHRVNDSKAAAARAGKRQLQ